MDAVDRAIMESFTIDPIGEWRIDDASNFFEDGTAELESYIQEAKDGATKGNIISKLITFIKKVFAWIAKRFQDLWKFIKRIFARKAKTADQCVSEALGNISNSSSSTSTGASRTSSTAHSTSRSNSSASDSGENSSSSSEASKKEIDIVSIDQNGNKVEEKYTLAIKGIQMQIMKDDRFSINLHGSTKNGYKWMDQKNLDGIKVPKQNLAGSGALNKSLTAIARLLVDGGSIMPFLDAVLESISSGEWKTNAAEFNQKCNKLYHEFSDNYNLENFIIDSDGFEKANTVIQNLNKVILSLDPNDKDIPVDSAKGINVISSIGAFWQWGLNALTGILGHIYEIDASYAEIIDNTTDLSKAIEAMIDGNIPSKYIAWNVYALCVPAMREYSDIKNPKFGQSRCVLYPSDKSIIYKFALNRLGIRDINMDTKIYNAVAKAGYGDILAKVISVEKNFCVSINQRTGDASEAKQRQTFAQDYNNLVDVIKDKIPQKTGFIIKDVHQNNVGYLGNKLVAYDYGTITSTRS